MKQELPFFSTELTTAVAVAAVVATPCPFRYSLNPPELASLSEGGQQAGHENAERDATTASLGHRSSPRDGHTWTNTRTHPPNKRTTTNNRMNNQ